LRLIDIDAYSRYGISDMSARQGIFYQYTNEFLVVVVYIVRPFDGDRR
jgi:hypothetical protein